MKKRKLYFVNVCARVWVHVYKYVNYPWCPPV